MLKEFETISYSHLGRIVAAIQPTDLEPSNRRFIHSKLRRVGRKARDFEKQEVERMPAEKVIDRAQTEWAAPISFAPKKDGLLRFLSDYRKFHAVTVGDLCPLPRMDESVNPVVDATVFRTPDENSSYWQIEVKDADWDNTAVISHHVPSRFRRMSLGLKCAPGAFQRTKQVVLSSIKWQHAHVYLSDVVVFSKTPAKQIDHLRSVLTLSRDASGTQKTKSASSSQPPPFIWGMILRQGAWKYPLIKTTLYAP